MPFDIVGDESSPFAAVPGPVLRQAKLAGEIFAASDTREHKKY